MKHRLINVMVRSLFVFVICVQISAFSSSALAASKYKISWLGDLGVSAVNNSGQVTGTFSIGNAKHRAFLYEKGAVSELGTLGGGSSFGSDINNTGQIVGHSFQENGPTRAFIYDNGQMKNLGSSNAGSASYATAINDHGQVVGNSDDHAVLYENGNITRIHNSTFGTAVDINNKGQILGIADSQAFLYENGNATNYSNQQSGHHPSGMNNNGDVTFLSFSPDGRGSVYLDGSYFDLPKHTNINPSPNAISDSGAVVGNTGFADSSLSFGSAFLFEDGEEFKLSDLIDGVSELYGARDISDNGKYIVGYDLIQGAYLLEKITISAVPLPGAVWLFGAVLGAFGFWRRKQIFAN